jgi:FixJ family two-component response regulator
VARTGARGSFAARDDLLTSREREVISYVVEGLLNKQIAGELKLSEITVKIHRSSAMRKLEAQSVADLVRKMEVIGAA